MKSTRTEELRQRLASLGAARSEAEARLLREAQYLLDRAAESEARITPDLSAGALSVYEIFVGEAARTAEGVLYAVRVLRGVE
jgi:hypothetical protein